MQKTSAESVLQELDYMAKADSCGFPQMYNLDYGIAAVRLSAFSDRSDWALFIELIKQSYNADGLDGLFDITYQYGSVVAGEKGLTRSGVAPIGEKGRYWPEFEFRKPRAWPIFALRPGVRSVRVRSQEAAVPEDANDYRRAGVRIGFHPDVQAQEFLEWLAAAHRDMVFEPDKALLGRMGQPLPLVLRLHEWYHPVMPDRGLPSQTETFQQIAEVLATGNPTKYKPTRPPNTDWRNWMV